VEDALGCGVREHGPQSVAVANVGLDKPRAARQRALEVLPPPARQVVDHRDLVARRHQGVGEV
jgi:hypothetical protein